MRIVSLGIVAGLLLVSISGCFDMFGSERVIEKPRTWEFDLFVEAATNQVLGIYPRNDNSTQTALAITFKDDPNAEQRIPGPEIRVKEGDTVIIYLQNPNPLQHTLHLHGGLIPWEMDGVDYLTQFPIEKGGEFTYKFENMKAGTYWYHCHVDGSHHIDFGMYGALIVEERDPPVKYDRDYTVFLDEMDTCHGHGNTDPIVRTQPDVQVGSEPSADAVGQTDCVYRYMMDYLAQNQAFNQAGSTLNSTGGPAQDAACVALEGLPDETPNKQLLLTTAGCNEHAHSNPPQQDPRQWWYETHPVYNPTYNTFLINGKAFPESPAFAVKQGETVRFRIINAGNQVHTWHPHGHTMEVITKDGYPLAGGPQKMDTLSIAPGERYDYVMKMNNPGLWMIHDQMGQNTVNDNVHPGGMMACFAYDGFEGVDAFALTKALDCNTEAVRILESRGAEHHHQG